jgi:hypothetical protein
MTLRRCERSKGSRSDKLDLIPRTEKGEALLLRGPEQTVLGKEGEALPSTVGLYQDLRQTGTESASSQSSHPRDPPEGLDCPDPIQTLYRVSQSTRCFWRGSVGVFSRCLICVISHLNVPQGDLEIYPSGNL